MIKSIDEISREAEAFFNKKLKDFPILYSEEFKSLYIEFFIEGYFMGGSDSGNTIFERLDKISVSLTNTRLDETA